MVERDPAPSPADGSSTNHLRKFESVKELRNQLVGQLVHGAKVQLQDGARALASVTVEAPSRVCRTNNASRSCLSLRVQFRI